MSRMKYEQQWNADDRQVKNYTNFFNKTPDKEGNIINVRYTNSYFTSRKINSKTLRFRVKLKEKNPDGFKDVIRDVHQLLTIVKYAHENNLTYTDALKDFSKDEETGKLKPKQKVIHHEGNALIYKVKVLINDAHIVMHQKGLKE